MEKRTLTLEEVKSRVRQIRAVQTDYELIADEANARLVGQDRIKAKTLHALGITAHSYEDQLYCDVLQHHARAGCELAKEALKTQELTFPRYCA